MTLPTWAKIGLNLLLDLLTLGKKQGWFASDGSVLPSAPEWVKKMGR